MECPEDLKKRAQILYYNGFSGFQAPGEGTIGDKFVICWCDDLSDDQVNRIKELSGSETLSYGDYLGYSYLTVRWDEHNRIVNIFNAMLELGHWFRTKNNGEASFNPNKDREFTYDVMERNMIAKIKEQIGWHPDFIHGDFLIKECHLNIWNYRTDEGRAFCNYLRERRFLPPADYNHEDNYFNWPIFQNYDPETLLSIDPSKKIKLDDEDEEKNDNDDNVCMICLDREPNTMVLPCEDCVVCKECSTGLKNTNDHHTCVKCRRPITDILE